VAEAAGTIDRNSILQRPFQQVQTAVSRMEQATRTVASSLSVLKAGEIVRQRIAMMRELAN
jgi:hypothetical protein